MNITDKLGIVITTYNRATHLKRTLNALLAADSPVRDCQITVQSNHSNDTTEQTVLDLQIKHPNLRLRENPYNLGISGNICKAMELADREYHWNICDDDIFNWDGWTDVVRAIEHKEAIICVSNYMIKPSYRDCFDYQLAQMGFVPAIIIRTDLYTDTTIRNAFDNIFTLFPHLVPIITHINNGGKIHVIDNPIVTNGMDRSTDCSYLRGARPDVIFQRSRTMTWLVGYANILANIKDTKLAKQCFQTVITGDHSFRCGYREFFAQCFFTFRGRENKMQLVDLMSVCSFPLRMALHLISFTQNTPLFNLAVKLQKWRLEHAGDARQTH